MTDSFIRAILEIDLRIKEPGSLSWYCYNFLFTEVGLLIETSIGLDKWKLGKKRNLSLEEAYDFMNAFYKLHVEKWKEKYIEPDVNDSEQWILDVKYADETVLKITGSNDYPENWDALRALLIDEPSDKDEKHEYLKSTTIIPFPDYEKLQTEVEKLRTELSMLVLERDELVFVECKNIEMVYMLNIGGLEYKAFELNCAVLRIKRKIELIQAKKNRQEKVVLSAIEKILDVEFVEYQVKLDEQIGKMNSALSRSKGKLLSVEESKELKKLYRGIVKALHPDLNPDISEEKIKLFLNAVEAYKNSDLTGLRIISEMITEHVFIEENKDALVILVKEKERLADLIKGIKEDIIKIKSEYPYTMKSLIKDPDKIKEKKEELEGNIEEWNKVLALYKSKLEDIMR